MNRRFKNKPHIRYSNCYEEINSLLEVASGKKYLSVCSGFDNTLALLLNNPDSIVCFDYNIVQIYLAKLKTLAFKELSYKDILTFFGINSTRKQRITLYNQISNKLDNDTKNYFDQNIDIIKVGLIYAGKFEYYLNKFKTYILPLTNSKKTIKKFVYAKTIEEQRYIYQTKFNNKRFKSLFKIFFSEKVMSKLGRDKDYFKYANENLSKKLKERVDLGFNNVLNIENPYMQYIILGKFITLPEYLKEENYQLIKNNIDKINLIHSEFKEVLIKDKYDFLNLSDIFEYMEEEKKLEYEKLINEHTNENAKIVFWNMIVPRKFNSNYFKEIESSESFKKERPFFYQKLWRYEK